MRRILALLVFLLPVAGAILLAAQLAARAEGPVRVAQAQPGLAVRVATVEAGPLVPEAQGWGNVRPAETWSAIAEVRGTVVWRAPDLAAGRLLRAGTEVLRLDPADYQLAIAQAEADLASLRAESAQIAAEAANTGRVLELEQARVALVETDAQRARDLVAQGTAAPARADEAERALLSARRTVVELQNALALIPPRQDRNAAQVARTEAALARARRDLAHTVVTVPFDMRITAAPAELYQFVAAGQVMVAGEGFAQAEVLAQLPVAAFQRLLSGVSVEGGVLEVLDRQPGARLSAEVEPVGNPGQVWPGRVDRTEAALEARARTVQVVVVVDDPIEGARPPERIPLVSNLQARVTLRGPELPSVIAIPAGALHGGLVYLADAQDRLELRPVQVAFRQGDLAVIASGLEGGERLVLDDIAPAVPGMALLPVAP